MKNKKNTWEPSPQGAVLNYVRNGEITTVLLEARKM